MLLRAPHQRRELGNTQTLVWLWEDNEAPRLVFAELWIFSALFGVCGESLSAFQRVFMVTIRFQEDTRGGLLLFIYGAPFLRTLAMILIVCLSVHLRIRRRLGGGGHLFPWGPLPPPSSLFLILEAWERRFWKQLLT